MIRGPWDLPEDWHWVKIGDIFDVQQGVSMSPGRRRGLSPRPFLRTSNVYWGRVDSSSLSEMDFTEAEVNGLALKANDLLVCEGGEVGRTAIWNGEIDICLFQNHIHRLRAKEENIIPKFYMYWMQAAYQLFNVYSGEESRTAIPNLSGGRLKKFLAPHPTPKEQEHIVSRIEELMGYLQEGKRLYIEAIQDADSLFVLVTSLPDTHPPR